CRTIVSRPSAKLLGAAAARPCDRNKDCGLAAVHEISPHRVRATRHERGALMSDFMTIAVISPKPDYRKSSILYRRHVCECFRSNKDLSAVDQVADHGVKVVRGIAG